MRKECKYSTKELRERNEEYYPIFPHRPPWGHIHPICPFLPPFWGPERFQGVKLPLLPSTLVVITSPDPLRARTPAHTDPHSLHNFLRITTACAEHSTPDPLRIRIFFGVRTRIPKILMRLPPHSSTHTEDSSEIFRFCDQLFGEPCTPTRLDRNFSRNEPLTRTATTQIV